MQEKTMTRYQERMDEHRRYARELVSGGQDEALEKALDMIRNADRIVIGGGAGLSACGGLNYMSLEVLKKEFPALARRGYHTLWEALWDDRRTKQQKIGMMAAEVLWACYDFPVIRAYQDLLRMVEDKDYFVLTSNIDRQFHKAGFEEERIFEPQCSASDLQCQTPCCRDIWDGESVWRKIAANMDRETYACREEDIPRCDRCHAPAVQNMRGIKSFIPDKVMWNRIEFEQYIKEASDLRTVFLELGAGFNSPGVIRHPFQRLAYRYPKAALIRMNQEFPKVPEKIKDRSVEIAEDIGEALAQMRRLYERK